MDVFGCCSSYVDCSYKGMCLHVDNPDYAGCYYRKNLEAGRIFYGVNAGTTPVDKRTVTKSLDVNQSTNIYLHCFNRLFAIVAKEKEISRLLTIEQAHKLEDAFVYESIPYKLQIDSQAECVTDYPTEKDPAPANSRVVFEIGGEEFHLLNYNTWLIKRHIAESIKKAFNNHGIKARVELRGQYANSDTAVVSGIKNTLKIEIIDKRQEPKQENKAVQMSLFDITPQVQQPEQNRVIRMPPPVKPRKLDPGMPIGSIVIAKDLYWGSYRGELVGAYFKAVSDILVTSEIIMAQVRIIEMLEPPSQYTVLTKTRYKRDPYPVDSVQVFYLDSCKIEKAQDESLSATG